MDIATERPELKWHVRELWGAIGWLFPRNKTSEGVATTICFDSPPEVLWRGILFYEEVPFRPPFVLRLFLPHPVRTSGDKTRVGTTILCVYTTGGLAKTITAVEPPNLVRFEVVEQRLGIEACITTLGGSYHIRARGDGCEVVLTTHYRGHLRPRNLWRPLERFLAHRVHRYILSGMSAHLASLSLPLDKAREKDF
ncbi:MAG: hypothetical protein ACREDR_09485 [Blastocatellia bacterium]